MPHDLIHRSTAYDPSRDVMLHRFDVRTKHKQWSATMSPIDFSSLLHMEAAAYELLLSKLIEDRVNLSELV